MYCDLCRTPSARTSRYQKAHPGYKKKMGRIYYERNRKRIIQNASDWASKNRDKRRIYERNRRLRRPEHVKALARSTEQDRRTRKINQFVEHVDAQTVFDRDCGICQICHNPILDTRWHMDHRVPLVTGGEHSYANIQLSHAECNLRKGGKDARVLSMRGDPNFRL